MARPLERTESLCPVCLKVLPAEIWERGDDVCLERTCPEHGPFSAVIWNGQPSFQSWRRPKKPLTVRPQTPKSLGCPFDCGLCPDHGQYPCTVLVELTELCDLNCPVCFANSGGPATPGDGRECFKSVEELAESLLWIKKTAGEVVLQLSGGEPTLYPELPKLVAEAAKLFPAVQLNTNGLRLAKDPNLAKALALNGLSWVFLQFDGVTDGVYESLRGQPLFAQKKAAIAACESAGLSVVLVPTAVKGLNDRELGPIVDYARSEPIVRGVHVQPMTQAGRHHLSGPQFRLTIPEAIRAISDGATAHIRPEWAFPPGCEHERCSFHLRFRRMP
ncbi:MAG: radical SAM protein, partial [Deltaproteobacteria bacterium]|nr:radical SAM protein [Deltaproteobacteria bacterium]